MFSFVRFSPPVSLIIQTIEFENAVHPNFCNSNNLQFFHDGLNKGKHETDTMPRIVNTVNIMFGLSNGSGSSYRITTRGNGPLCGLTSSSCGGLRPSTRFLFALLAKNVFFFLHFLAGCYIMER